MTARSTPASLFAGQHLPRARKGLDGFPVGCRVAWADGGRGREAQGRVIAALPRYRWLVIRTDAVSIIYRGPADLRRID